jgi:hypothetical protein
MNGSMIAALAAASMMCSWATQADELRVDGTTPETTSATLHAIYAQHSHREICLLQAAFINIAVGEKAKREAAGADPKTQDADFDAILNGLDYDEIIAKSRDYPPKVTALCRD